MIDAAIVLATHRRGPAGACRSAIDRDYVAGVLAGDWGFHRDATANLDRVRGGRRRGRTGRRAADRVDEAAAAAARGHRGSPQVDGLADARAGGRAHAVVGGRQRAGGHVLMRLRKRAATAPRTARRRCSSPPTCTAPRSASASSWRPRPSTAPTCSSSAATSPASWSRRSSRRRRDAGRSSCTASTCAPRDARPRRRSSAQLAERGHLLAAHDRERNSPSSSATPRGSTRCSAQLMLERLAHWIDLRARAARRHAASASSPRPGTTIPYAVDEVIRERGGDRVVLVEGEVTEIAPGHEMLNTGWSNHTPWNTHREFDEDAHRRAHRGDGEPAARPEAPRSSTSTSPPYDSTLDTAPMLDDDLAVRTSMGNAADGAGGLDGGARRRSRRTSRWRACTGTSTSPAARCASAAPWRSTPDRSTARECCAAPCSRWAADELVRVQATTDERRETSMTPSRHDRRGARGGCATACASRASQYLFGAYVDAHGVPKSKCVPIDHLESAGRRVRALHGGRARGHGRARPQRGRVLGIPDLSRLTSCRGTAATRSRRPTSSSTASRTATTRAAVLKRQLAAAAELGLAFNVGIEPELYVLRQVDGAWTPWVAEDASTRRRRGYDLETTMLADAFLHPMVGHMTELGLGRLLLRPRGRRRPVRVRVPPTPNALDMADRMLVFRLMAKHVARTLGCIATFMPKPFDHNFGSGAHVNMSLADLETGENRFEAAARRRADQRPPRLLAARLPLHRRGAAPRARDHRGRLPDGQLLQAPAPRRPHGPRSPGRRSTRRSATTTAR